MNKLPDKLGWYWFKALPNNAFEPVEVKEKDGVLYFNTGYATGIRETWSQQWGERIPQPGVDYDVDTNKQ